MNELEKIFKALANRRRLAILKYLKVVGEASVADIADEIDLSFNATSKHLGILAARDIIDREQRSLNMFYSLSRSQHSVVKHLISVL